MATNDLYSIREWAPLTVIERLPTKLSRLGGLFPVDVNITCISVIDDHIALGSDTGVVFWYNRQTGYVQKLRAEVASRITCVRIVNSVEYMVAAGSSTGQVSVFQIQKQLPPDLNLPCVRVKPIQRYTIRDLHNSSVSCCEWSRNGMKLFSGDRQGVVVLTDFDYVNHLSKSVEILSEAYEIVQLSVFQSYLLVSTLYRSIICQRNQTNGQWLVLQVGKKDRKQLIDCGGILSKRSGGKKGPQVICGRPGMRFCVADTDGNVEKTLLFREAVANSPTWEIPILNPKNRSSGLENITCVTAPENSGIVDSKNFHELYLFGGQDSLIVTHDESTLYILNLDRLCVEAVARGFRKILDFCVCDREIFVLEGERSLLRLAPTPEKPNKTAKIIFNPKMPPPVPPMGFINCGKFESPVEYEPESGLIIRAEECFELAPIETLSLNIPIELAVESPRAEQNRRLEIFNQIAVQDFDQPILFRSDVSSAERKKRRKSNELKKSQGIVEIGHLALRSEKDVLEQEILVGDVPRKAIQHQSQDKANELTTKCTLMEASFYMPATCTTNEVRISPPLPNLLTPNTLKRSFENKSWNLPNDLALDLSEQRMHKIPLHDCISVDFQSMATTPPPPPPTTPATTSELVYVKQPVLEDAAVQTTPKRKFSQDECDYSNGQPVDDICATLQATKLLMQNAGVSDERNEKKSPVMNAATAPLRFVSTQPILNDAADSFLLNFSRAGDPLCKRNSPPPSSDSNTSSEWEFLDN